MSRFGVLLFLAALLVGCEDVEAPAVSAVPSGTGFIPVEGADTADAGVTPELDTGGPPACIKATCAEKGAECGAIPDGCGNVVNCGTCPTGQQCGTAGLPNLCGLPACVPTTCAEKEAECGAIGDGCGGTLECGECPEGSTCGGAAVSNRCACTPKTCEELGVQCGPTTNGCGTAVDCGECEGGAPCVDNVCQCVPQCDGKECGEDGCGGSCGECQQGSTCAPFGACQKALCAGKCGQQQAQDCGQSCECYCDEACWEYGDCCPDLCESCTADFPDTCCTPECDGKECGDDGCGGSCGGCEAGLECQSGACQPCVPQCAGKQCGDDGCGGSCGACQGDLQCSNGACLSCAPDCAGRICGPDGCGGSCGDCEVACKSIPEGPFELVKLQGPIASEDLAFDAEGHVVGSNDKAIFKSEYGKPPQVWVPSINFRAGLRFLPTGDLMVNNDVKGQLQRIEPDGTINVVLSNLAYPNGMAVDMEGFVYVTEHDGDRVLRVEPYSKTYEVLTQGTIKNPNGIAFNATYDKLFVAGFSGVGTIYVFNRAADGSFGEPLPFAKNVGTGWLDGIGIDICGNLYVADYYATKVYRFPPDGSSFKTVISGSGGSNIYLPNMQWGSGKGGWRRDRLYLPDGWNKGVFEVDLGVNSGPVPYP